MQKSSKVGNYEIKISTIADWENVQFTGDIVVSDPCYYIPDDVWQELCKMWFDNGSSNAFTDTGILEINGMKILYSSTAHGDGSYSVSHRGTYVGDIGVDAGMFSFILLEDFAKLSTDDPIRCGVVIKNFNGEIALDGHGNADGTITVVTDGSDEEEQDDRFLDDEENEW